MQHINTFKIKQKLHDVLSFFCGRETCVCCGEKSFSLLCSRCLKTFIKTPHDLSLYCNKCGSFLVSEQNTCLTCRESPLLEHVDFVLPLHSYRLWKKELLFQWKMLEKRSFSPVIANMYDEVLQTFFPCIPIVPVPPRPGKIRKKDWDQMDEIAQILAQHKHHRVLKPLQRLNQRQQKKLNREERLSTIGKIYTLKKGIKALPQKVVLIDDIVTTGATIESCALVLKDAGVKEVYAVCLFGNN